MEMKLPQINLMDYKWHIAAFFIYLVIALVMFWNISSNIGSQVVNGGGDVYQSMWGLWWVPFSLFTLHQSPYLTSYLFAPVGANLAAETMSPLAGIITAPLQALVGVAVTYNFLFFTSFALGGLFMFMLARYLVKNNYAAFIAGLIFAFSPMHIAQSYSHLQWTIIEFIPLFILYFLLMIRTRKKKYALYAAITFVLLSFAGDIEQGIMMLSFAAVSLILFVVLERKEVLNRQAILNVALVVVFTLVIASPFLISIVHHLNSALSSAGQLSDVAHNMLYADNLASFFVPSYYNGIFHNASLGYVNSVYALTYQGAQYSPDITEKISYLGYSVIFLALLALYHEHRKNKMRDIIFWIAIIVVFGLLALGPYIQIGTSSTPIPTLYALYRDIPLFNLIREPGRFDIVVTVALAVLAAIGFEHLTKTKYNKSTLGLAILFTALILIEYNGTPLSSSFASMLTTNAQIPSAYHQFGNLTTGNSSVLLLPTLPNFTTGSFLYPGISMYYQTAFKKPLFGGYTTRENSTQAQLLENVPLVVSAGYLESGQGFLFPYPIREDYSNLSIFWLSAYNVGTVAVNNNAYNQIELANLLSYLDNLFGNPVYQDANVTVFSATGIENVLAGRSMTSYIVGTWIPGYEFCTGQSNCNSTFETIWWGSNVRAITIFSPNKTKVKMDFQGTRYGQSTPLYFFLDTNQTPFAKLNLSTTLLNYSLPLTLPAGLSQIAFYQPNSTSIVQNQSPYLNFGLRNITFVK